MCRPSIVLFFIREPQKINIWLGGPRDVEKFEKQWIRTRIINMVPPGTRSPTSPRACFKNSINMIGAFK